MRRRRLGLEGRALCTLAECDRDRAVPQARGRGRGRRGGRAQSGDGEPAVRQAGRAAEEETPARQRKAEGCGG